MYIITIDESSCEGCDECVSNCPAGILCLNGEQKAEVAGDMADCTGCESCVSVCSTASISVQEV